MELSAFIELLSMTSDQKAATRAARKALVARIEARDVPRRGQAHAPEDHALLGFLIRHL